MTASRRFVAPGKLMVAGEYSVLSPGGAALALAVEPGLEVAVTPARRWELARGDGAARWREGQEVPGELRFVHAAWSAARARLGSRLTPRRISTRVLGGTATGDRKPGVGGSASAAAAVVASMFAEAGRELGESRPEVLDVALGAHLAAQGGVGSGYDVATVVHGGLLLWRPGRQGAAGRAAAIRWPAGLDLLAGYTGQSANTAQRLERLARVRQDDAAAVDREMGTLASGSLRLVDEFRGGRIDDILLGIASCQRDMSAWDQERRLGIMTPEIELMVDLARSAGAVAKVSGAGGGDSILAFAAGPKPLERVRRSWREAGFLPLPVALDERGVREVTE